MALAAPMPDALARWTTTHVDGCEPCAERLDALLAARHDEAVEEVEPLRAAASAQKVWAPPAPLERLGVLAGVPIYRVPGDPERLAADNVEWIGRRLEITIPGEEPIRAEVDRFRRLVAPGAIERLAAALARGAPIEVTLVGE
jgi:hypothetical protein